MKPPSLSFSVLLLHAAALSQALSTSPQNDAILYATDGPVTLSSDGQTPDTMVLDFGQSYEGHPTFEVLSASGDTSRFEVSFGESSAALGGYMNDGPLPWLVLSLRQAVGKSCPHRTPAGALAALGQT
ncbi:hypothetical protein B0T11DRAFT_134800 [Plectosphaerella cucumerina]|uniref:Uncharacterized protein n=1 Tax=Plectosphaerella cucumerina TaxID=40658 RepID=A0A8K0TC57_9PEZI|nr:hypothetical protein B0T11DRAFT_134800 [Plectosphaerella cucumerina]